MSTAAPGPGAGAPIDPLVGQVLAGRYRIVAKLGEGAMGAVYVGEHLHIGRRDAIKVLRPGLAGDAEAIARFTRGTRNVSAIRHPNVCTIYDFCDTPEGLRFLAMEFVEGETLKQLLDREGRLEVPRAVAISRQVADALQAAHDVGVVHRDLKPGNIMLWRRPDGSDAVKVVDFDIAKGPNEPEGEEVTRVGFVVGTPEYMSPEQLMGDRLDGRSDLYSLGVVLFRMLTGGLPFRAASTQEMMVQRLTAEPLPVSDVAPGVTITPALQQVLNRALARRAGDRQASAAEFARELVAAVEPAPAIPEPQSLAPEVGRGVGPPPRRPVISPQVPGAAPMPPSELAATMIGPVAARAKSASGDTFVPRAGPQRRRRVPMALAASVVGLVIVGVSGTLLLNRGQPPAGDAAEPVLTQGGGGAAPPVNPTLTDTTLLAAGGDTGADQGNTGSGLGGPDRAAETSPARPASQAATAVIPAGGLGAMLDRQLAAIRGGAEGGRLEAVRDSAELGWRLATSHADSVAAALVLTNAALRAGDDAACARWARRGVLLDAGLFEALLQACQ